MGLNTLIFVDMLSLTVDITFVKKNIVSVKACFPLGKRATLNEIESMNC
jgi:hypothetical protein